MERKVVPHVAGNARLPAVERRTGGSCRRWEAEDRRQPSSWCHVGGTSETRL